MASYLPPTEDLPIFDNSVFEINNNPLTFNDAQKGFLAFPYAQGNETFQDIIVDGTTDFFNQVDNHSTMPPPNNATTIVPTTAWVQGAIAAAPVNPTITTSATSSVTPLPIPILSTATPGVSSLYVDSTNGITYTPSTDTLTVAQVNGNASSATQIYNNGFNGNQDYPIAFLGQNAVGNQNLSTDIQGTHLSFNPNQNTMKLSGNLSMTATTSQILSSSTGTAISCPSATAISFPSANVTATTFTGTTSVISPIIRTTNNGVLRTYDTGGVLASSMQQLGSDLNITIPATGEMKITTQGTGAIPTSNADAGTSFLWNVSAGGGESCIVNYQDGGNAGGFDFYNVNSVANSVKIATIPKTQSPNGTSSTTILPTYSWVNGTISDAITAISQVPVTNTTSSINYFLPLVATSTTGNKTLFAGGSIAFNPSINTMSTANFSASASISSPYYTSPSGGSSRWYSTDNTQYGQIYSDNTYNLKINPAYKLGLTMNTQVPSNNGVVNPVYTQGCDIGWNYNGQGSTDFYNNAGLQATTTHQAFSFWDASTALIQQPIAYIPRIQSGYGATGLNLPTYDWVNGTITNAINSITPVTQIPVNNTVSDTEYFLPMLTSTSTGQKTVYAGGNITINPATDTIDHVYLFGLSNAGVVSQIYNQGSNMVLQSDVGTPANTYIKSRNNGSAIPVGSVTPAGTFGTVIGYNTTAGQYETDLLNYSGNLANVGGFNFYTGGASSAIAQCGSLPRTQPSSTDSSIKIPTTSTVQKMIKQGSGAPVILFNGLVYINYPSAPIVTGLWINPYLVTAGVSYSTSSLGNMAISVAGVGANFNYGTVMGSFPDIGSNQGVTFYGFVTTGGTDLTIALNRVSGPTVNPVSQNGNINIVVYAVPLVVIS